MLAAALIGVNCKTAAYYFLQLREIIMLELEREADNVLWEDYHWTGKAITSRPRTSPKI